MEFDLVFQALSDATRRRLLDELKERDGQTLFELHVRMTTWYGASLTRQGLSRHLAILERAGLVRVEWQWRSKHHYLETVPIMNAWKYWLRGYVETPGKGKGVRNENRADERTGR